MAHPTEHQPWCDRGHVEIGSPECSAEVGRVHVAGATVIVLVHDGAGVHVGVEAAPVVLTAEQSHQLGRLLTEAGSIYVGTWEPLREHADGEVAG